MKNQNLVVSLLLGVVTVAVIGWTVHLIQTAEPTVSKPSKLREMARQMDRKERAMSPEQRAEARAAAQEQNTRATAASWTAKGVYLSKDQGIRLMKLGDIAIAKGTLTPDDVDYLVASIADPQKGSTSPGWIHYQAAYDLEQVKDLNSKQRAKILSACMPLIDSKAPLDQRCAITGAKIAGSSVAVPAAKKMLTGDNDNDRKSAKSYLNSLAVKKSD